MMQPFLTIGIPTWNRCTYLKKNVEALVRQIQRHQLDLSVELLISDNGSSDATPAFMAEISARYAFVRHHRHAENRGANANFQFVIEAAQGEYVWLLGDDDLLVEDIITKVIADIKTALPAVVVGPAVYDDSKEKATHQSFNDVTLTNSRVLSSEDVITLAGKISGLIFHKASVLPIINIANPIILATRTPWPHLVWFLLLLNDPNKKLLILPYGINQLVAANWFNLLFDGSTLLKILFIDYQTLLLALKSHLDSEFYAVLLNRSVATRQVSLLKCVLYGTYLNGYWQFLSIAVAAFPKILGLRNKFYYLLFLLFPLMIPTTLHRIVYYVCQFRWKKIRVTIQRIHHAKYLLTQALTDGSRSFDNEGL